MEKSRNRKIKRMEKNEKQENANQDEGKNRMEEKKDDKKTSWRNESHKE